MGWSAVAAVVAAAAGANAHHEAQQAEAAMRDEMSAAQGRMEKMLRGETKGEAADKSIIDAQRKRRQQAASAVGPGDMILTGKQGVSQPATTENKVILGM